MKSLVHSCRFVLIPTIIFVFATIGDCQSPLTSEQWRQDLQFLRETITTERDNLFHTMTREEFEQASDLLYEQIPSMKQHEIIIGLARLVSMARIGHTMLPLDMWRDTHINNMGFHRLPMRVYLFSEGVYILSADQNYAQAVGGRVIRIGRVTIEEALEALRPVVPYENEQGFKSVVPSYLSCPEVLHAFGVVEDMERIPVAYEKESREQMIWLEAESGGRFPGNFGLLAPGSNWVDARSTDNSETPLWLKNLERNYYFEYLPKEKMVYVRHSQVRDESDKSIAEFFSEVFTFVDEHDVERFVLDLRLNGGGNNYRNRPVIVGLIQARKINQPGRLFTIIGRGTFSAAQNLVNEIEKYTETIFVGEPTSENVNFWGDVVRKNLPNSGLQMYLSHLWWQNLDPRDTRPWTAPQIAVDMTFEDYTNNRDPVLQAIIDYTPEESLVERLRQRLISGDTNQARRLAFDYRDDPKHRYDNVEDQVNRLGYELMGQENLDAALATFRLNIELFPESANTYDSLAECYWNSGNLEAAVENYERSIRMDPGGPTGANSARMLERIRAEMASSQNDRSN